MDFTCSSNESNENKNCKMNKTTLGDKESVKKSCAAKIFDEGINITNRSAENYHEPLEASHGARIMANESAREKEQLEQKITCLETEINAKEKENALLKETLFERDKEIVDLKEKLSQLQQNGPRNQLDFAKQMAIMDEKLQETRKNIEELENGLNFSLLKKETKFKSEPQTFNGNGYFDPQPSWFDTLSNNAECREVENFPVTGKDLEVTKNVKLHSKPSNEPARDKGYFDLQPSWFDTISNNAGCLKIDNLPVLAKDLEAMRNVKSNSKPSTAAAKGSPYSYRRPLPPILASTVPSGTQVGFAYQQINQHSIPQTDHL
ncbi:structural maintenance of chromosomes protein 2 [Pocillopora verrucosa]|uniref:structural maintenance of chromosomes protein 2 n=1 Tax=Pocillopora verrucosa TaxID=203993 RepID=UPI003340870A